MTKPTIEKRLHARTPMMTALLLFDDEVDDEIGAKGADVVPPFSEAGVPSDEDDLTATWNASKVSSVVGLTANTMIDWQFLQATHDGTNTKKRRENI